MVANNFHYFIVSLTQFICLTLLIFFTPLFSILTRFRAYFRGLLTMAQLNFVCELCRHSEDDRTRCARLFRKYSSIGHPLGLQTNWKRIPSSSKETGQKSEQSDAYKAFLDKAVNSTRIAVHHYFVANVG